MFCDEALNAVEAVAAGELKADGRLSDHYATCPNCAAALDSARALERMLSERAVPQPPPQFTTRTLARVRRARWRSDQFLDLGFNVVLGMIMLGIVLAVWIALRRTGLAVIGDDVFEIFGRGFVTLAQRAAPSLPLYGGATALLVTALAIWWWAERDAAL